MKIIDRHLYREYLTPLTYNLLTFCMLFVIIDLFGNLKKFIKHHVPPVEILTYYGFILVPVLELIAPVALLLSALYTLAKLTRHNELTAMRASGVSRWRLMTPFLTVGLGFVILIAVLKETVVPRALDYTTTFFKTQSDPGAIATIHEKIAYMDGQTRSIWWIERLDASRPHIAHSVIVTRNTAQQGLREEIAATRAEWMDGVWWFFGYVSEITDDDDLVVARSEHAEIPVERRDIRTQPDDLVNGAIRPVELLTTAELHRYIATRPYLTDQELAPYRVQFHQRLASPWTCLVVLLFAIPAGARTGRAGAMLGIVLAVSALFGYYALREIGMYMGIQSVIPSWSSAWLPNIVFCAVGVSMSSRMM